jgi:hypothetical protein
LRRRASSRLRSFPFLLLRLYLVPQAFDGLGIGGTALAEDMRVTADEFRGDRLDHVAKVEGVLLLRHTGMKHDL